LTCASCSQAITHSLTHSVTQSPTHPPTHPPTHSLTHSLTQNKTTPVVILMRSQELHRAAQNSLACILTHSLTHSLYLPASHPPRHSPIHYMPALQSFEEKHKQTGQLADMDEVKAWCNNMIQYLQVTIAEVDKAPIAKYSDTE